MNHRRPHNLSEQRPWTCSADASAQLRVGHGYSRYPTSDLSGIQARVLDERTSARPLPSCHVCGRPGPHIQYALEHITEAVLVLVTVEARAGDLCESSYVLRFRLRVISFCLFVCFIPHTSTSQLLGKPWPQVSSLLPPASCLQFLSRTGFSNPTARRFSIECC